MIKFTTKSLPSGAPAGTLVEFELEGGVCTPEELYLVDEQLPGVDPRGGVVVSGRGPVWLFAAVCHAYHPTAWVATHDPRLGGGVVAASHVQQVKLGDIIPVE